MADALLVGTRTSGNGNLTSGSGTSSASGSTFVIALSFDGGATVNGPGAGNTPNDSKGNTYTFIDSQSSASTVAFYYCANGTGGSGHTATANFTGSSFGTIYLIELTGVLTASPLDKTNKAISSSPPINMNLPSAGTFSQADEIILAIGGSGAGSPTYTSSNMTIIDQEDNGGAFWTSVIQKLVIASTAQVSLNFTGGDANSIFLAASFKSSGAAADTFLGQALM